MPKRAKAPKRRVTCTLCGGIMTNIMHHLTSYHAYSAAQVVEYIERVEQKQEQKPSGRF